MRGLWRAVGMSVAVVGATLSAPGMGAGATVRPAVLSVSVSRFSLPAHGWTPMIGVRVRGARTCELTLITHPWATVTYSRQPANCAGGVYHGWATIGPNQAADKLPIVFRFSARDGASVATRLIVVTLQAATTQRPSPTTTEPPVDKSPPPVTNLDACTAGTDCDYGPIYATYQSYGNTAPDDLGDCTFAAAANWEQIVLNVSPEPTLIAYEFGNAGGTAAGGLAQSELWTYWEQDGINGIHLTGLHSYLTAQTDVQNGVRDYGAMIVEFNFAQGTYFGNIQMNAGLHDAVVDGFTPEGPLVVSWGQTIQLTWQQWSAEVMGMWGIGAS